MNLTLSIDDRLVHQARKTAEAMGTNLNQLVLSLDAQVARRKVELFARFDLVIIQLDDILAAIDLHRLHTISLWVRSF